MNKICIIELCTNDKIKPKTSHTEENKPKVPIKSDCSDIAELKAENIENINQKPVIVKDSHISGKVLYETNVHRNITLNDNTVKFDSNNKEENK